MRSWPNRFSQVRSSVARCALLLLVFGITTSSLGCSTVVINRTRPCPVPAPEVMNQMADLDAEGVAWYEIERYLGEIYRYCDAISEE